MSDFIEVAKTFDLPLGRACVCTIGERRIALYHTSKGFFASENTCAHRGGPLGEGDIIGDEIVCPWHLWSFEIATGVCLGNPDIKIATHEVRLDGDRVLVKIA
ncbi:MAG TPA: Rieske 2Fe-2S domain-containing protein [Thermoanaerobaculia bacterium]